MRDFKASTGRKKKNNSNLLSKHNQTYKSIWDEWCTNSTAAAGQPEERHRSEIGKKRKSGAVWESVLDWPGSPAWAPRHTAAARGNTCPHPKHIPCDTKTKTTFLLLREAINFDSQWASKHRSFVNVNVAQVKSPIWHFCLSCFEPV